MIIIILIVALISSLGYIAWDKKLKYVFIKEKEEPVVDKKDKGESPEKKEGEQPEKSVVLSNEEKREILNIIGLDENGVIGNDKNDAEYIYTGEIFGGLQWFLLSLSSSKNSGVIYINDLEVELIQMLFLHYCWTNTNLIKPEYSSWCEENTGMGYCFAMKKDNYQIIASKYGITNTPQEIFDMENDNNYIFSYGGGGGIYGYAIIKDNVLFTTQNDDNIVVKYAADIEYKEDSLEGDYIEVDYTFKNNAEGSYYLDSVYVIEN